jgi:outer membrane immunogenic protein
MRISAKSVLLGAVSVIALASAAHAADPVVPVETSGFNWSGVYVGFGVGVGANVHELSSDFIPGLSLNGIGGEGVFGELTAGYDYMVSPRFLLGGLLDAHVGNIETTLDVPAGPFNASIQETYGFDAGLRAGYLFTPNTLGYVLGGYSWQKYKLDSNAGFGFDWDQSGYFIGAGVETAINSNWTIKTEYRYTRFGTKDDLLSQFGVPDGALNLDTSRHTFQVAANYHFGAQNGGAASFEAPTYNWTGFYIGGAGGAGASVHQINAPLLGDIEFNGLGGEGVFGELNVGYDHDFGNWVAGLMVDGRYSGMTSKLDIPGGSINLDTDYGFDLLGRVGMKVNESTLAYALGGYSWQHFDLNASAPIGDILDWGSSGFSVGGGLETAVSSNVTVGLEYRYSQFAKKDLSSLLGTGAPDGLITTTPSFQTVRIDAKYKFN